MMSLKAPELRATRSRPLTVAPTRVERRRASDRRRVTLLALVLVALSLRAGFLLADPYPVELAGLARSQGEIAHNLLTHGRWFAINTNTTNRATAADPGLRLVDPADLDLDKADADPHFVPFRNHMPGPALLLAAFWAAGTPERYLPLQVAQAVADSAVVLLVYWIAMRLFGRRRTALFAAAGYALFVPIAATARIPFYDPWAVVLTVTIFALFLRARTIGRAWPWLLATGVATGAGMWFRAQLVLLPLVLGLALVKPLGWRRAAARGIVPAALALLLVLPYSLWTRSDGKQFSIANTGVGQVLWEGLGQRHNDFGAVNDDLRTFEQVSAEHPGFSYAQPDYDDYLRAKALRAIGDRPGFYAALVGQRLAQSLVPLSNSSPVTDGLREYRAYRGSQLSFLAERPLRAGMLLVMLAGGMGLLVAATAGLATTWRRHRREHLLLLAAAAATFVTPVLLVGGWRYVAPATFVYLILGSLALDRALVSLGRWRSARPGGRMVLVRR